MLKAKLLYKAFKYIQSKHQGQLSLANPMSMQEYLLQDVLQRQASTIYGQKYRFDRIRSINDFQRQVPLTTMADYEPYFNQLKKGTINLLFKDKQIAWLQTSGTTNTPKLFPFTEYMAQRLELAPLNIYLSYIEENPQEHLKCLQGKFLSIVADPEVGHVNGLPVGYVSGVALALKAKSRFTASMFTPTLDILMMKDWEEKFRAISQQSTKQNVSLIAGVPVYIAEYLMKLESIHKAELGLAHKTIPEIWPKLKLMIWSGAKLEGYQTRLTQLVGDQVDFREAYGATETGLIAYQQGQEPGMVPVLANNFCEFIPLQEWRSMEKEGENYHTFEFTVHTFQDVTPGVEYVIVFTTVGGLYRYVIGDTVIFEKSDIPRFNWAGRIKWWSNITVERMSFSHIQNAIGMLEEEIGSSISNFSYTTCYDPPQYQFIIETTDPISNTLDLVKLFDKKLQAVNGEYEFARTRKLLCAPLVIQVPSGTYELFSRQKALYGAPLGQMKPPRFTDKQTINLLSSIANST
ncbi:MAG: GH3 auxin-responsive promoter family protein [Candidatus Hermodarchaeota archaeon]